MGLISDILPIGAIRELPFYGKLIMELVGSLATIGYVGDFVDDPDMTHLLMLLNAIKDLFLDIVYLWPIKIVVSPQSNNKRFSSRS